MSFLNREEVQLGSHLLTVKERIAEGGFGFVDLVVNSITGTEYVLKRCGIQRQESYEIVNKEINMLQRFRGQHIVSIIASEIRTTTTREALILLEYCPGGHLLKRINDRHGVPFPMNDICKIFKQLLDAVAPFHRSVPPIIHRDLKLENILFGKDGYLKLCDFGSCITGYMPTRTPEERSKAEENIGKETTQMYRAPEMVDLYLRDELTEKTDIWALGCIFYALCFNIHPFQDAGNLGILSARINLPPTTSVSEDAKVLLLRMLDMDPEARPDVEYLLEATCNLAAGTPLPPFELSEEAVRRKAEREANQARRQAITTKKKAPVVPPRAAPIPLDSNSVAAKRLAAKKSGAVSAANVSHETSLGAVKRPVGSGPISTARDIFTSPSQQQGSINMLDDYSPRDGGGNEFDVFSTSATVQSNNRNDEFDPFDAAPAPVSVAPDAGFDLFDSAPAVPAAQSSTFDMFDAAPVQASPATSSFDMFDNSSAASSAPAFPPAAAAFDDVFSAPATQPTKASPAAPDPFGSNELLSMSTTAPKAPMQNVLSLFDQQSSSAPKRGGMGADPFADMGGPGMMPPGGGYGYPGPAAGGYPMHGGNPYGGHGMGGMQPQSGAPQNRGISTQRPVGQKPADDPFGSLNILKK